MLLEKFSCGLRYVVTARAIDSKKNCGTKPSKRRRGSNFLRKVVPPARFQRATSRLGVGFTSLLFSTVTKKLNKNACAYVAYCACSAQFVKNCGTTAGQTWTKRNVTQR